MQQHPSSSSLLRTDDSPAPSSGTPGDMDCTIVVDPDNTDDQKQQQHQQRQQHAGALPASSSAACLIQHDQQQFADEEAAAGGKDVEALPPPPPAAAAARPSRPRTYYIDWLRVFLTVLVVVHHCVVAYQSSYAWGAKKGDTCLFLFSELFVNGNQAYFMTLFFFLSGLYVPGSYKRKGPGQFLLDRTLRLVVPCIFYSFLAPPFILWWNDMSKNPTVDPAESLGRQFRLWLKPGWPSQYNIATGPPWFIWMLWCFNVAYVVLKVASSWQWFKIPCNCLASCFSSSNSNDSSSSRRRSSSGGKFEQTFSDRELMRHAGILTAIMFTVCYAARILDKFAFNISPLQFYQRGPFMSFMPDLFPTYVVAFALGTYSGPSAWNVLARLPDSWGSWSLWVGGCWWVWAGWLINVTLRPAMVGQRGLPAWIGTWLLRTFVEQSFCVIWSIGLLVVFRRAYNIKPRLFGQYVINGAYGAYLVHMVVLILFARVIMSYSFPSAVVNAGIIALPSVVTSWLVAVLLRAIPGAHHVL